MAKSIATQSRRPRAARKPESAATSRSKRPEKAQVGELHRIVKNFISYVPQSLLK